MDSIAPEHLGGGGVRLDLASVIDDTPVRRNETAQSAAILIFRITKTGTCAIESNMEKKGPEVHIRARRQGGF